MSDQIGIAWIGAHSTTDTDGGVPGMLGGISLTCARGIEQDEFLINLGADLDELAERTPYRELVASGGGRPDRTNYAMYGTCGEWVYVLEDWGMSTWSTGFHKVKSMWPAPGEEFVCVTMNWWSPPRMTLHVPGDERVLRAEFGEDTGEGSALDAALREAGALIGPRPQGDAAEAEYEARRELLPAAVFTAVGAYCGLSIDRAAVEAGDLPAVLIPMV
ncbi:hypothetical protein ACFU90_27825 [Streptomyces noursei]|uniref:Uncharacterized protein n=2 Tax=Streptomyces noursei TaxID=1971 RepID=A0A059W090_STRNR|nr:hypothetical protein [Streptomyces noursei]AKA08450.1 hypothetical protein SAZ_04170 [Streptomyces noursei ZPM]AIA01251.1 hypothetical protein DC74_729 [Streptomyces noursei]EOT04446.1 hypothetical protein K530_08549 [Streptomyces noursei CCRC 11814]EXU89021.1 hypothetical protein P354_25135 [Streptomyces noursei PD-1]UWS70180.1 hypothetical protein N1H47_02415 [Streptomyces noursei]